MPQNKCSAEYNSLKDFSENGRGLRERSDAEILELILCDCSDRRNDIEGLAEKMICRCGSLRAVFCIGSERLKNEFGFSDSELLDFHAVKAFLHKTVMQRYKLPLKLDGERKVFEFLRDFYMISETEELHIMSLDQKEQIDGIFLIDRGAEEMVSFQLDKIISVLESKGAQNGFILTHNHPNCCSAATSDDRQAAAAIYFVAKRRGFLMKYHYIFGDDGLNVIDTDLRFKDHIYLFDAESFGEW